MNGSNGWWPLAVEGEVRDRPLRRVLRGVPLVLFRGPGQRIAVLHDRCCHRHAPLSEGRVRDGQVECPYHGWRFSASGCCTRVPGTEIRASGSPVVAAVASRTAHGMVWACLGDSEAAPDPVGPAVEDGVDAFFLQDVVECTLEAAAENFLDGTHTHFVHSGWIRRDRHRQAVRATVTILEDGGVQARYTGEGRQSGAISRFLEPDRLESMGRFRLPGIAEIEYRGRKGLNLLVTAWLVPESDGRLRVFARVATPKGFLPAWLKRFAARWLFGVILRQDASILESTGRNIAAFRGTGNERTFLDGPLDLLGPSIRRLLRGQPAEATAERTLDLHL